MMHSPRIFLFSLLLFFLYPEISPGQTFTVGAAVYSERQKFAGIAFPSSEYGTFRTGIGPNLSLSRTQKPGEMFLLSLRTAVVIFPMHNYSDASGTRRMTEVLVPLEGAGSFGFSLTQNLLFSFRAQAGPQFISTLTHDPVTGLTTKTTSVKFGGGIGVFLMPVPKQLHWHALYVGAIAYRIGRNNFAELEIALPLEFTLK